MSSDKAPGSDPRKKKPDTPETPQVPAPSPESAAGRQPGESTGPRFVPLGSIRVESKENETTVTDAVAYFHEKLTNLLRLCAEYPFFWVLCAVDDATGKIHLIPSPVKTKDTAGVSFGKKSNTSRINIRIPLGQVNFELDDQLKYIFQVTGPEKVTIKDETYTCMTIHTAQWKSEERTHHEPKDPQGQDGAGKAKAGKQPPKNEAGGESKPGGTETPT